MTERSRGQPEPRPSVSTANGSLQTTLLLAPEASQVKRRARRELLETTDAGETHVIGIVYNDRRFIDSVHGHGDPWPDAVTVVSVGAEPEQVDAEVVDSTHVATNDATKVADHVLDRVREVATTANPTPHTILYFDSLTALLRDVGLERGFRFVDSLVSHLEGDDVHAHFHLDPTVHPSRTHLALSTLFDAVLQSGGGESWTVKQGSPSAAISTNN